MRDRETDSWWSIITGDAIGGSLEGTPLVELASSQKMQWGEWLKLNPDTRIQWIEGSEHDASDPSARYFDSADGFRGLKSADERLSDKTSIYAFQLDGVAFAVPHSVIEGGVTFTLDKDTTISLHREPGSAIFASTEAYLISDSGRSDLPGFDTFWYIWSTTHDDVTLLK